MNFSRFTKDFSIERCPLIYHSTHAFVTWIIYDLSYIQGALVLGSSLRHFSPGILRVCLLEEELSTQDICNDLQLVFDRVVIVKTIMAESRYRRGKRFENYYKDWIHLSFTRIQCLRLRELFGLTKIVVLDADTVAVRDLAELFDIPAPAGILSFNEGYQFRDGTLMCHNVLHGRKIPSDLIQESIEKSYGVRGCLLVLEPCHSDFQRLIETLEMQSASMPMAIGAYGDESLHIGPDEKLLTEYYHKTYQWTHLHQKYCMTSWHLDQLGEGEIPSCLHFVSQKPWDVTQAYYTDYDVWYLEVLHLLAVYPHLKSYYKNSALDLTQLSKFSSLSNDTLRGFKPTKFFFKKGQIFKNIQSILSSTGTASQCVILTHELSNSRRNISESDDQNHEANVDQPQTQHNNKSLVTVFDRMGQATHFSQMQTIFEPLRSPYNPPHQKTTDKTLPLTQISLAEPIVVPNKKTDSLHSNLLDNVPKLSSPVNHTHFPSSLLRKALSDISKSSSQSMTSMRSKVQSQTKTSSHANLEHLRNSAPH